MEPELHVFPMLFYVLLHHEHQRRQRRQRPLALPVCWCSFLGLLAAAGAGSLVFLAAAGAGSLLFLEAAGTGSLLFLAAAVAGFLPLRLPGAGSFTLRQCALDPFPPRTGVVTAGSVDWVAEVLSWVFATLADVQDWEGGTDTVGEDTGDVCMAVVEVSASEVCVLLGVVVVDEDVVHAGVSVDGTGREVEEE
ncbi:hypothetical protein NDU88_003818 [Pleurodeles waltl]|uniref:Uncharacterized protein n=1 Tax=Pleurodeles waltl TaxID=8319 RepID=A0AAV7WU47_PLEWA|nr:hypothetical protein NDU88_003818 [Pleurodeles waltl]